MHGRRAFLENHAAQTPSIIVEKLGRADAAAHQDDVVRQIGAGRRAVALLAGDQMLQQAIGNVLKVVQALAQIRIADLGHADPGVLMHLLHRRLGRQTRLDGLGDARRPSGVLGKHPVGFQHIPVLADKSQVVGFKHLVEGIAHPADGIAQPFHFQLRILGHQFLHHHLRLMHDGHADGDAAGQADPLKAHRQHCVAVHRRQFVRAHQVTGRDQLGQNHGDGFKGLDFFFGVMAPAFVLNDQNADHPAAANDRHADQRMEDFFAGFRPVGEVGVALGIGQGKWSGMSADIAHQAFAHPKTGLMHGGLQQAFGGEQFQHLAGPHDVAGTDLGHHVGGDQLDHFVQAVLGGAAGRHDVPQPAQQPARNRSGSVGHQAPASSPRRDATAATACPTSSSRMSLMLCSRVTMPTLWPAISDPFSTSPSMTARLSAPAQ